MRRLIFGVSSLLLLSAVGGLAKPRPAFDVAPVVVSPGHPQEFSQVSGSCPTFNWSAAPGADAYELVVFRLPVGYLGDPLGEEPVVRATLPRGATGWTPSLERCLEPDAAYAWSVRAIEGGSVSQWASPHLFRIALAPSRDELEQALDVVLRYRGSLEGRSQEKGAALASGDGAIGSVSGQAGDQGPAVAGRMPSRVAVQQPAVAAGVVGISGGALFLNPNLTINQPSMPSPLLGVFTDPECDEAADRGKIRLYEVLGGAAAPTGIDALCLCRRLADPGGPGLDVYQWACFH